MRAVIMLISAAPPAISSSTTHCSTESESRGSRVASMRSVRVPSTMRVTTVKLMPAMPPLRPSQKWCT